MRHEDFTRMAARVSERQPTPTKFERDTDRAISRAPLSTDHRAEMRDTLNDIRNLNVRTTR